MKVKTSELIGPALDWAVGSVYGLPVEVCQVFQYGRPNGKHYISIGETDRDGSEVDFNPCEEWSQGGPIIEREGVNLSQEFGGSEGSFAKPTGWVARIYKPGGPINPTGYRGPNPLIAAMRCYVASKLGEEVEVPDELIGE